MFFNDKENLIFKLPSFAVDIKRNGKKNTLWILKDKKDSEKQFLKDRYLKKNETSKWDKG